MVVGLLPREGFSGEVYVKREPVLQNHVVDSLILVSVAHNYSKRHSY